MYNPYVRKGEWIDCDVCNSAHRRILDSDLIPYINEDGSIVKLSEEESTRCYKCQPILLHKSFHCNSCNHDDIIEVNYEGCTPTICNSCGHDNAFQYKNTGPAHFEKRPTLTGEGRELFNRIKKRNYGSTMPDY